MKTLPVAIAAALYGLSGCMTLKSVGEEQIKPASLSEVMDSQDYKTVLPTLPAGSDLQLAGAMLIRESDRICFQYLENLSTREKGIKSSLNVTSLILTAAAGVTTPVESKDILTALSTAGQGVENSLSTTILGGIEGDLIVQANRKGRRRQRAEMVKTLLNSTSGNKNFMRFMAEFETYHDSCGISYGRDVLGAALASSSADEKPSPTEVNAAPGGN